MYTAPNTKTISIILLLTMLVILACLPVASLPPQPEPTPWLFATLSPEEEPASGTVYQVEPTESRACATVTALEALHLRADQSETARVITWLSAQTQVTLLDASGKWWKIAAQDGTVGYANSAYLERSPCQ